MTGVYKVSEVVGTSRTSMEEALKNAVEEVSRTVRHMTWFEIISQRGRIVDNKIDEFQVILKVGFKVER